MLVDDTDSSKLNVCARSACSLCFNVDAYTHRRYWSGIRNVCVERNVYLGPSAAMLEEEDLIILTMCSEQAASQQP